MGMCLCVCEGGFGVSAGGLDSARQCFLISLKRADRTLQLRG